MVYGRRRSIGKRALAMRPIDSTKNIYQINDSIASGAVATYVIASGVNPAAIDESDAAKVYFVEDGASLRGFTLQMRMINKNADASQAKVVAIIWKSERGTLAAPNFANLQALGTWQGKSKVFACAQLAPPGDGGIPMVMAGIRIPKRFHKMNLNDTWNLSISNNSTGSLSVCGFAVYKWYK